MNELNANEHDMGCSSDTDLVETILRFPKRRSIECCGHTVMVSTLEAYFTCPSCVRKFKLRGYGPVGGETQDIIDAVLQWMGTGEDFDLVMEQKRKLDEALRPAQ